MLEQFFTDPAAAQRLRAGLLGSYVDSFATVVSGMGYCRSAVRVQLWLLGELGRWLEENTLGVADLKEEVAEDFLAQRRRQGRLNHSAAQTLRRFLDQLRAEGAIPSPVATVDDSPLAALETRYKSYLRKERGLAEATIARCWYFPQRFLVECFADGAVRLAEIAPQDVSSFLLQHARSGSPRVAKPMVTALRSFFRFLFQHGETETDLAGAVPTVPAWRLAEVPRFLKPEEVERVVDACDRSTAVGRRDHAVILLLARLGLRAGEVVALELDDVDWRAGEITVRGKGRFHDRLPLPSDVGEALASYLRQDRPNCSTRKLFLRMRAPRRGFSHPSTVSTIVRLAVERAGLSPPLKGAHLLRHSLATGMLRQGASMAEIGEILRHRTPNTTEIYAKVDTEGLRSLARPWPSMGGER